MLSTYQGKDKDCPLGKNQDPVTHHLKGTHFIFYFYFILFYFWPHCAACGILVSRPGIKPASPEVEVWSLNHWTAREVPNPLYYFSLKFIFIYLLLAVFGLCCCARAFSSCGDRGLLFVAGHGLLIAVASLAVEHGL